MSGGDKPPSDRLAQCFAFFKETTGNEATGLQKFIVATVVLGPLLALLALAVVLISVGFGPNLISYWPWLTGAVPTAGIGFAVISRLRRRCLRAESAAAQPQQGTLASESRAESDETPDQDGCEVRDGSG